jgi:hypothetical protein
MYFRSRVGKRNPSQCPDDPTTENLSGGISSLSHRQTRQLNVQIAASEALGHHRQSSAHSPEYAGCSDFPFHNSGLKGAETAYKSE